MAYYNFLTLLINKTVVETTTYSTLLVYAPTTFYRPLLVMGLSVKTMRFMAAVPKTVTIFAENINWIPRALINHVCLVII